MAVKPPEHRHPARRKNRSERTGFVPGTGLHGGEPEAAMERAPRPAWVSDALLAETIEVWTDAYGRPISESEALEILDNVKRLGEALLAAKREMRA